MVVQLSPSALPQWYSLAELINYCGLSVDSGPGSTIEVQNELVGIGAAVFELFRKWGLVDPDTEALELSPPQGKQHIIRGFTMLVARLYRRRNSPGGIEALGETGPVYISRRDPDIAMLLGLGEYTRPAVG